MRYYTYYGTQFTSKPSSSVVGGELIPTLHSVGLSRDSIPHCTGGSNSWGVSREGSSDITTRGNDVCVAAWCYKGNPHGGAVVYEFERV